MVHGMVRAAAHRRRGEAERHVLQARLAQGIRGLGEVQKVVDHLVGG